MRTFILGILTALLLGAVGERAYEGHRWKQNVDTRGYVAERAATYLFGPAGVATPDGRQLSRQQLLDAYLHAQVEAHPEWGLSFEK